MIRARSEEGGHRWVAYDYWCPEEAGLALECDLCNRRWEPGWADDWLYFYLMSWLEFFPAEGLWILLRLARFEGVPCATSNELTAADAPTGSGTELAAV